MSKAEIIKKVYFDPGGYASNKTTLKNARDIDKTITKADVDNCLLKNTEHTQKKQLKGYNSCSPLPWLRISTWPDVYQRPARTEN